MGGNTDGQMGSAYVRWHVARRSIKGWFMQDLMDQVLIKVKHDGTSTKGVMDVKHDQ